jgi:hypothetical protein
MMFMNGLRLMDQNWSQPLTFNNITLVVQVPPALKKISGDDQKIGWRLQTETGKVW